MKASSCSGFGGNRGVPIAGRIISYQRYIASHPALSLVRRLPWVSFLLGTLLPTSGAPLIAQVPTHSEKSSNPPEIIGRYVLEAASRPRVANSTRIFHYFDGKSSRIEVIIFDCDSTSSSIPRQIAHRQEEMIKTDLLADRHSGRYDDYLVALDDIHVDTLAASTVSGYRIVAVVRQANRVHVDFSCTYALRKSIVRVRALIPQADWQATDAPTFADQLVAKLSQLDFDNTRR